MEALTPPKSHNSKKKKRKAIEFDTQVQMLKEQQEKNAPMLGYYPSGFDPLNLKNPESSKLGFFRDQKRLRRVELVVKPNGSKVDYVGNSHFGEAAVGRMNSYALAVVDKRSQSFRLAPINANRVFRLQPLARASRASETEPETPAKIEDAEDRRLKRHKLTDRYGTKGAIKKDKEAMRLSQKEDPDVMPEINQILEATPIDKTAIESSSLNTDNNLPPHDLSATTPEKAYLLDKIILKGEWDYVRDILERLQSGQEIKPDVYPSFVCNRCYKVELNKDEAEKSRLAGILSYISHLINIKNRYSAGGGGKSSKHHVYLPSILSQKFDKMFINKEKNRLSDDKIGSLISYVLVLTLFVDEFQTDFTDIAKDLKMSALSLRPYFENLGCKFARRNKVTVATLPTPLKFPTLRKRRRG
ncbi:DNA-directed RNA polymerase I subunit rpa49-like [Chenopodium quinoa]|uniref:DNA-directed RNA polymerase I subunit rpa49 n=1 Tax=Chenopodium quinoa TaxID=63459 RepID=A0A803LDC1_CHEQI|nr:DNA-directed RNA polymerase I subunit rpa49-like [Chenopodium quinoa]